jgi:hypothetical protein
LRRTERARARLPERNHERTSSIDAEKPTVDGLVAGLYLGPDLRDDRRRAA